MCLVNILCAYSTAKDVVPMQALKTGLNVEYADFMLPLNNIIRNEDLKLTIRVLMVILNANDNVPKDWCGCKFIETFVYFL